VKKIIREVDEKRGIVQVTIADERWYIKEVRDSTTGLPEMKYVPSVTWISGHYPKGIAFYKWLADKGWDESQALKSAAGDKGSKIHYAISRILEGEEIRIDSKIVNPSTEQEEELTLEECDAILSFVNWKNASKMVPVAWDRVVFSDQYNYAGSLDLLCTIDGESWLIDFKSGQYVWPEYELQVSAYKKGIENGENEMPLGFDVSRIKLGILQVGYRKNKAGYKLTELEDKFPLFLAARQIWENESASQQPSKREYPIVLSPAVTVEEALAESNPQQPRKAEVKAKTKAKNA
jgi:hypothetical protein